MEKRKHYSYAEQEMVIGMYRQSGKTLREFCATEGVEIRRVERWLKGREEKRGKDVQFVEVEESPVESSVRGAAKYRLGLPNGGWLEIDGVFEKEAVRELVGILRDGAC